MSDKIKLPPTLVIGLGGTGCDIVSRIDKLSNEKQKEFIRFVYFDTDANELRVRKEESPYIFTVQTSKRITVGQALRSDREARENSFPTSQQLLKKPLTEGAGQVRAVSKLAFDACLREGRMKPLHDAINELQHLTGDTLEQSMRVVIVSTLVGGTGSGILLPVSMYLRRYLENICQKKPIVRGFCVLPDVFFHDSTPKPEVEKNNLRVNAYAALRELDAFMMKADAPYDKGYAKYWLKMPAPGTVDEYDEYTTNPMDFCFLYDGLNMDGNGLQNLEAYKQHVADCVYAACVSILNKRLNSSEDNTILSRCEQGGRNRYCGIGSSKIVYPFAQVRDYIAMSWMRDAMSEEWLKYDRNYAKKAQQQQASRRRGVNLQRIDRRDCYCEEVENDQKQNNYFSSEIFGQAWIQDPDGGYSEEKWVSYYRSLLKFITDTIADDERRGYDEGTSKSAENAILDMEDSVKGRANDTMKEGFRNAAAKLKRYFSLTKRRAENRAEVLADSLFSPSNFDVSNPNHIEYWLTEDGSFIHPNAVRYFLYRLEAYFRKCSDRLTAAGKFESVLPDSKGNYPKRQSFTTLEAAVRGFFEQKRYEKPIEDEKGERDGEDSLITIEAYVNALELRGVLEADKKKQDRSDWEDCVNIVINDCRTQNSNIREYYRAYLELAILKKALEHINRMCGLYEYFFQQIEAEIGHLPRRIERIGESYVNDTGAPVLYACASKKCLEGLLDRCPNIVDPVDLTPEFRNLLFRSLYQAVDTDNEERQHALIRDVVEHRILDFWRAQVVDQYGAKVDMDVIDALRTEAEIEENKYDADDQKYYIRGKKEAAMKLAAPFIDKPIDVQPYTIEACSLNDGVSETDDVLKAAIIRSEFAGHESDALMDKYQMLFMKALYNIRVTDLPKFAPADINEVDPIEDGSYFKAYWKRLNNVIPDDKRTKFLTPHLDRRWHYTGVMPDLSEKSEKQCMRYACRALFICFAYDRIAYVRDQYRFRGADGEYISDSITVRDGRCNKFCEVFEAMLMSRPLVIDMQEYYKDQVEKEKQAPLLGRKDYTGTELYKVMETMHVDPFAHHVSFLELPILDKVTAGGMFRDDREATDMLRYMIDFIDEYLAAFYPDKLERTSCFVRWIGEQTNLLCNNLKTVYGNIMANPFDDTLVKSMREILKARIESCTENCQMGDSCVEDYLKELEQNFCDKAEDKASAPAAENA